jgi:hypothetical protein
MFKKFEKRIDEVFAYSSDPLEEGKATFVKKIKLGNDAKTIAQIVGHIDGIKGSHTAIISIRIESMDSFGEDSLKQRMIIHQKDFKDAKLAEEYLSKYAKTIIYVG